MTIFIDIILGIFIGFVLAALIIGGYLFCFGIENFDYLEAMDDPDWGGPT